MFFIINAIFSLYLAIFTCILSRKYIHILQLKSYKTKPYLDWLKLNKTKSADYVAWGMTLAILGANAVYMWLCDCVYVYPLMPMACVAIYFAMFRAKNTDTKIPLKITPRVKRIYVCIGLITAVVCFGLNSLYLLTHYVAYAHSALILLILPRWCYVSVILNSPIEKRINSKFLHASKSKLSSMPNLIKIGITGSAGKTSVKNILAHILDEKYKVFATPASYNTPMGICRAINELMPVNTEIFIAELGAKNIGDVRYLCEYLGIQKGIITCVCGQHLESFGDINNIYLAKKELSDYLGDQICVYNIDNPHVAKMYNEKTGDRTSISTASKADLYASKIKIRDYRTTFDLHYSTRTYHCDTALLGEQNVTNILLASAMALQLGVDIAKVTDRISSLSPTPHRLEYIRTPNGINILDDTFNCSVESSRLALSVLAQARGRKIVCTPGIVEAGEDSATINATLAQSIEQVADIVIVIGNTNKQYFTQGLQNTKKSVLYFPDLKSAQAQFAKILNFGDNLLLLNDLPDDYD